MSDQKRVIKLYTKTGDQGTSRLYDDATRIPKNDQLFYSLGSNDELSARIGMLCALIDKNRVQSAILDSVQTEEKDHIFFLREVQGKLQHINNFIATTKDKNKEKLPQITDKDVEKLEKRIDFYQHQNDPLRTFILPGVTETDSQAQLCRTQARLAEREIQYFKRTVPSNCLVYLNRLSDLFFAMSRFLSGCSEMSV